MAYGDKRDYRKIDISKKGFGYLCSTTWARNCKEAREKYIASNGGSMDEIDAHFAEKS